GVSLVVRGGQSAAEMLRHQDAARLTPEEIRQLESSALSPLWRGSRRRRPARKGKEWDASGTLRRTVQRGECWELARRRRVTRRRRTVWICDVSGSMDPYSRMVLRFVYALARRGIPVEVFVCSTRLTRVTPALKNRDPERALSEMWSAAPDWSGGTRLARALRTLRLEWGWRVLRGAGLILVTDGLEAEDPGSLGEEMQKLRRLAAWTVWLNPALSDPEYRPVAKGSAALQEVVDAHWPGYSWECLESAWKQLEENKWR
ncbi:MAG: VWA domain-containing protein, partial [Alicyclobacillaceae bacterium]|nr:VWA domain-containing protein [Alicyclobacillaceae bacterium]